MKRKYYYLLLLIILSILSACAPTKTIEKEKLISPDRLVVKLEANRRKIKSFVGSGVINVQNKELKAKSNFEVNLKKTDSLRVDFFGPFGIELAQAVVSSNGFLFYDVINNKVYKGNLKEDVLQKILKVNLSFNDVIDALTGSVNLTDKLRREPDKFDYENNFYKLTYIDSINSIEKVFLVKADDFSISESIVQNFKGEKLLEAKFSNFKIFDNVPIPYEIKINDFRNNQQLKIEYRNINVNKELPNLNIEIPDDAKILEW